MVSQQYLLIFREQEGDAVGGHGPQLGQVCHVDTSAHAQTTATTP